MLTILAFLAGVALILGGVAMFSPAVAAILAGSALVWVSINQPGEESD